MGIGIIHLKKYLISIRGYLNYKYDFSESNEIKATLRSRSIRGGGITILSQTIKAGIQFISVIILSRLFAPQDFGLIAMVSAIFSFLSLFQDLGLTTVTIQQTEINHEQISTLFWINILFSFILAVSGAFLSPLISWFFHEPKLGWVAIIMSTSIFLGGFGTQHRALLLRNMLFGRIAFIEISAIVIGIITAVILAPFKYWALVAMSLATSIASSAGFWLMCGWKPGFPSHTTGLRQMLSFGSNLTGVSIMNYFSRNLDNVLIGRVWGPIQLGFYARAYNLFMIPMSQVVWPLASVATPVFSRLQDDRPRFKKYYLSALSAIAFITIPLSILLIVLSDEIVLALMGNQWQGSIRILKFLSLSILVQPVFSLSNVLFVVTGRGGEFLKYSSIGSIIIICSFFIGLPFGSSMVALCYSIAIILWTFPNLYFATRKTPIGVKDVIESIMYPFAGGVLGGLSILLLKLRFKPLLSDISLLAMCLFVMLLVYIASVFWLFNQKSFYSQVIKSFFRPDKTLPN